MSIYRRLTCPIPNCLNIDGQGEAEKYSPKKCKLCGKENEMTSAVNHKGVYSSLDQRYVTSQHRSVELTEPVRETLHSPDAVKIPERSRLAMVSDGWPVANSSWKSKYSDEPRDKGVKRKRAEQISHSEVTSEEHTSSSFSYTSSAQLQQAEPKQFPIAQLKSKPLKLTPDLPELSVKIVKLCQSCGRQCNGTWIMGYDAVHCSDFCLKITESMLEKEDEMNMNNEMMAGMSTAGSSEYDPEHEDYISKTTAFKPT
ncbi:hypothetical protein GUITHDRAFT_104815 [Guillardia theta CCMP2712]|uniref:Uncharacterized protein n=1 Tax=Guillardia theta (strain CCMP2712) TaxID=905079 RepID=L1JLA2_GUITC|nr:hypothetical protein GUITHDRAFT_104815 [Guillardia theta CCMP2712]EKX49286.1 hypothetical protein GUITHDRAFT_104815 [Guillardia theta CCMP2712]|eukprot:XP_005836266.1 hypothetical protein GUITHDRAFT_104815 [Guillardia theta CCMP2712]